MKHFILLTTVKNNKLAIRIEDITRIDTFTNDSTTVFIGDTEYYVRDKIEDILYRINQIVYEVSKNE